MQLSKIRSLQIIVNTVMNTFKVWDCELSPLHIPHLLSTPIAEYGVHTAASGTCNVHLCDLWDLPL